MKLLLIFLLFLLTISCADNNITENLDSNESYPCTDGDTKLGTNFCGYLQRGILELECIDGNWEETDVCNDPICGRGKVLSEQMWIEKESDITLVNNYRFIERGLYIVNSNLSEIVLDNICYINNGLFVQNNDYLKVLNLKSLFSINGDIYINQNNNLKVLNVDNLSDIAFSFVVGGTNSDDGNRAINVLSFPKLRSVGKSLTLGKNVALEEISFPVLEYIGAEDDNEGVVINSCNKLKSFSFPSLKSVAGFFQIGNLYSGTSNLSLEFFGARNLESVGALSIYGRSITRLSLPELRSVTVAGITIKNLSIDLELPSLETVTGLIHIEGAIEEINMPNLKTVSYYLKIEDCSKLKRLNLDALQTVNGELRFSQISSLESISLPDLTSVAGSLIFGSSDTINSIESPNLTNIGISFELLSNDDLLSIDFSSLSEIGQDYLVKNNPQLPTSDAEKLRDQVQNNDGIGGTVMIEGNKE